MDCSLGIQQNIQCSTVPRKAVPTVRDGDSKDPTSFYVKTCVQRALDFTCRLDFALRRSDHGTTDAFPK
jgi:hypothetical protein